MSFIAGVNPALRSEVSQGVRRLLLLQLLHRRAGFIPLAWGLDKLRRQKAEPWLGPASYPSTLLLTLVSSPTPSSGLISAA